MRKNVQVFSPVVFELTMAMCGGPPEGTGV